MFIAGNQLTDRDAHHFIEPLRNNMSLTCLDLSHNNLAEMSGLHLAAALVKPFVLPMVVIRHEILYTGIFGRGRIVFFD